MNPEEQIKEHTHNGLDSKTIDFSDITRGFEVVSVAPVDKPQRPGQQIKIYTNGATYRLYWYDSVADVWHYVTATA